MRARLTKIKSSHGNLSKDEYEGNAYEIPTVGHSFLLVHDGTRTLITTEIQRVESFHDGRVYRFWTKNSEYEVLLDPNTPLPNDAVGKINTILGE